MSCHSGVHVGSLAIRNFIKKWARKGLLIAAFHGHIHESPAQIRLNGDKNRRCLVF